MTKDRGIPEVVDEIAFQTRRNLAQRALADILPFTREDERAIRAGARELEQGIIQSDLPPRYLVSAASYALARGRIAPRQLARQVIGHLNSLNQQSTGARFRGSTKQVATAAA
jgi:DNA-binding NarL/FixJ family response regulator